MTIAQSRAEVGGRSRMMAPPTAIPLVATAAVGSVLKTLAIAKIIANGDIIGSFVICRQVDGQSEPL